MFDRVSFGIVRHENSTETKTCPTCNHTETVTASKPKDTLFVNFKYPGKGNVLSPLAGALDKILSFGDIPDTVKYGLVVGELIGTLGNSVSFSVDQYESTHNFPVVDFSTNSVVLRDPDSGEGITGWNIDRFISRYI